MTQAAKALAKILSGKSDASISFAEAPAVLNRAGFQHDGGKGSHQIWRHADGRKIILPRHGNAIKPIYIKQIRKLFS